MPITDAQRAQRRGHVGASDVPALLGLDPWGRTPTDVYWDKVAERPDTQTASTDTGNRLETVLVEFARERTGLPFQENVRLVHEDGILAANCDGIDPESGDAVEAKVDSITAAEWGAEGSDEVPLRVLVQAEAQIACGASVVWVPALIVSRGARFALYRVAPHPAVIAEILRTVDRFWHDHVEPRIPPDGNFTPPLDVLTHAVRGRYPVRLGVEALPLVEDYQAALAMVKRAEAARDHAKAEVLALLGEADEGLLPDGRRLTFFEQRSAPSVDHGKLRAQFSEAYAECVSQGSHRRLLVRERK